MSKQFDLLPALDEIIPLVASVKRKYSVTEILEEHRYEFFAVSVTMGGFGDSIWRGIERTVRRDWGKATETYEVEGPQVAERLREVRKALASGFIELRKYQVTFDPSSIRVQDYKLKPDRKIMFDVIFVGEEEPGTSSTPALSEEYKFCVGCGQKLESDAQFCSKCGQSQQ
jgi:hypothetical protein